MRSHDTGLKNPPVNLNKSAYLRLRKSGNYSLAPSHFGFYHRVDTHHKIPPSWGLQTYNRVGISPDDLRQPLHPYPKVK